MATGRKGRSPWSWVGRLVLWITLSYAALLAFFWVVFRLRARVLTNAVRAFNKQILNPAMMRVAGGRHWYAAVIWHSGRRSGKQYGTPVVAEPIEAGFIIPLPYGEDVDWLRNVLAAKQATIDAKGASYFVVDPEVINAEAAFLLLPPRLRRTWRLFGIDRFLKVTRVS